MEAFLLVVVFVCVVSLIILIAVLKRKMRERENSQFNKEPRYSSTTPIIRTLPTYTGNARTDAINAEYNAKMGQAISNFASSDPKAKKSATGAMVKGAVVGKLIGGAVVGAMIAKEKHDEKNK